ncbi:MAG: class I SAM-dependent methyltransferase [Phycisphaerales bacterium]
MPRRTTRKPAAPTVSDAPPDWTPLDETEHVRQVAGLRRLLGKGKPQRRILDLGCGDGRTARPLIALGHRVVGIDRDPRAVWACATADFTCIRADFLHDKAAWKQAATHGPFDAITCLGHTFLMVTHPDDALALLERAAAVLRPSTRQSPSRFIIDDYTALWREVAEGNWQEGLSESDAAAELQQLVWGEADNTIALRKGRAVRRSTWRFTKSDEPMRLWTRGELELLARAAGWTFTAHPKDHLGVFSR